MADNTQQGALDTIATDELVTQNGVSVVGAGIKVQRVKPGYGLPDDFTDVSQANGLPIDSAESLMQTVVINSASATAAIDTTGFSWISVHVGVGYTTQTALIMQASNDIAFTNPVTVALSPAGSTSSGLSTALGITNQIFTGPIPGRFIRFSPTGTFTSGSQTLLLYLQAMPGVLQSVGTNTNISAIGGNQLPAVANSTLSIGTGTQNGFEVRQTSTADQAVTTLLAAVSGQIPYITGIHVSVQGAGATPRLVRLVAAANALIEQNVVCPGNDSRSRMFRNPYKPMSTTNNIVQLAVTSIGTAAGVWDVVVEGYYQTS